MEKFIKRKIYSEIKKHLSQKEITLIIGPRQVGKTTLMKVLKEEMERKGKAAIYFDLDREADFIYFKSQSNFLEKLKLELGERKAYVFIDEIQRKEDAGLFLKGLYDMDLPYKFVVSGSGSLELKEKIHESLVGRKRVFEIFPVSFEEFVNFKTNYKYENNLNDFFRVEKEKRIIFLKEYLNFGGYPRVISAEKIDEKQMVMDDIFKSYLEKDISYLLKIDRPEVFSNLVKIIANQIGELTNYQKISSYLNLSLPSLKKYLWYGEKTFIIRKLTPFFSNPKKEIVKSPVYYFYDLGLRNYALANFGNLVDFSKVFENLVLNVLIEKIRFSSASIHFWRTKDKAEVDFVVKKGKSVIPFEVKFREFKTPKIERSLKSFIEKYQPNEAFIINLNLKEKLKVKNVYLNFLPIFDLITFNFR